MSDAGGGGALPTGCYKCGRPGHWSRDCPSSNPNPNPNPNSNFNSKSPSSNFPKSSNNSSKFAGNASGGGGGSGFGGGSNGGFQSKPVAKPKKAPRTRPKLTPELLLSDEGLGYILRYFPKNFKYRGRGHEVNDLKNLLRMYAEWHEQLLPYFPFDQFIHKVEDVGSTRRVKNCIAELKERVANGGDPTKLKESATEEAPYDKEDVSNVEQPALNQEDLPFSGNDAGDFNGNMPNEIYNQTVEEASISRQSNAIGTDVPPSDTSMQHSGQSVGAGGGSSNPNQVTEEQKALMEAKRQKALERAAARSRLLSAS